MSFGTFRQYPLLQFSGPTHLNFGRKRSRSASPSCRKGVGTRRPCASAPRLRSSSPSAAASDGGAAKGLSPSQPLRLPVIFRKITFGSQSLRGAQALVTNLSLITTAKRHGKDPLELIKTILLKAGDTPLDAIYDTGCLPNKVSS